MDKKISYVIATLGLVLGLWAFWFEQDFGLHTRTYPIKIENWKLPNYKIAVVADIHTGSPYNGLEKLEEIVALTNASGANLILIAGDFVIHEVLGGSFVDPAKIASALKKLSAEDGVYAVLGNHDHWFGAKEVTKALEDAGIPLLMNQAVKKNGFWLVGIDDEWAGHPDLSSALEKVLNDDPIILFTHNPDIFVKIPERVDLTIAGHTHGGQVYIPLIGRPVVPSNFGERFAIGHIKEGRRQLFVNPGTGTSILPVRFLVPPEISIVEIK